MAGFLKKLLWPGKIPTEPQWNAGEGVTYVVGDIHGQFEKLKSLIDVISGDARTMETEPKRIVFLGDLIDRGPDGRAVIDSLVNFKADGFEMTYIMGNHEEMFLSVLDGNLLSLKAWFGLGGRETARSYGVTNLGDIHINAEDLLTRIIDAVPTDHIDFIKSFKNYIMIGDYLCVHAGIDPKKSIEDQKEKDMRWIRRRFLDNKTKRGFMVVHGHSVVETPEIHVNRIAIDTGAGRGDQLTAVRLFECDVKFLSVGSDVKSG